MNKTITADIIIVGSGIAGLSAALTCADYGKVLLISKDKLPEGNTARAQGGVAVPLSRSDSELLHIKDTLKTGSGLSYKKAVSILVRESKQMFRELSLLGLKFDEGKNGFDLRREGAHSKDRIVHASGDYTGREIENVLIKNVRKKKNIEIKENEFLIDLIVDKNRCCGIFSFNKCRGGVTSSLVTPPVLLYSAKAVLVATGGIGQVYTHTSNSLVTTGDGIAAAYRAGAELTDLEFVQFHPTALYTKLTPTGYPEYLITEALRGAGARLLNKNKKEFMSKYHPEGELSSRDIVSRSIFKEMWKTKSNFVYLDISKVKNFKNKFPQIVKICKDLKIGLKEKLIPVVPTVHYFMGGVKVDLWGRTNIPGLFAAGEAACTGAHGANRLASNSLSESYVFGKRAAQEIERYIKSGQRSALSVQGAGEITNYELGIRNKIAGANCQCVGMLKNQREKLGFKLKKTMWEKGGVFRCGKTLLTGLKEIKKLDKEFLEMEKKCGHTRLSASADADATVKFLELKNMLLLAKLIIKSALTREESRGSHFRTDYPERNDKVWKKHIIVGAGFKPARVGQAFRPAKGKSCNGL